MALDKLDPAKLRIAYVCCYKCGEKWHFRMGCPYDDVTAHQKKTFSASDDNQTLVPVQL